MTNTGGKLETGWGRELKNGKVGSGLSSSSEARRRIERIKGSPHCMMRHCHGRHVGIDLWMMP